MLVGYLPHGFDLLNVADLSLVTQARTACEHLVVGVLSDDDVCRRYGRPPVVPMAERVEIVRRLRGVDEVVVHDRASVPLGALVFTVVGEAPVPDHRESDVPLAASRTSTSAVLRHALRPAITEAVA